MVRLKVVLVKGRKGKGTFSYIEVPGMSSVIWGLLAQTGSGVSKF